MSDLDQGGILHLSCRYYRVYTDPDTPCTEANFRHVERVLPLPAARTALVLVDVWSTHYVDSWIQRAGDVTRERIVPLLDAARRAGVLVIHAPSPRVAERYAPPPAPPAPLPEPAPVWPPSDFRSLYRAGRHAPFGRLPEPRLQEALVRYVDDLDIAEPARPAPGEPVIHTGPELHRLLAGREIMHLVYAGFATNWCVLHRDYGILAMGARGYNIVLLRDATTGVEFHDTVDSLGATRMTVREIETKHGWSATTADFISACAAVP